MSDKSKASRKEGEQFTVYPSVKGGIEGELRDRAVTKLYPIGEFYKPSLVAKALDELVVTNTTAYTDANGNQQQASTKVVYVTAQGNKRTIDHQEIKQKLADNVDKLKVFYDKQKQKPLAVTAYKVISDTTLPSLEKYFTLETIQPNQWLPKTATITRDINGASTVGREVNINDVPDLKNTYKQPITGYLITDKTGLAKALDGLKPTEYREHKNVEIMASQEGNTIEGLKSLFTDLIDLTNACGITDDSGQVMSIGKLVINQIHLEFLSIISRTLAGVLERNEPKGRASRSVVNIKDPESHRYIGRPSTTSFIDMVEGAVNGRELKNLGKIYRTKDEREAEGGFLAHIDNPQVTLPFIFDDTDKQVQAKFMANSVALAVDAVTALQGYKRDNPDNDGYIKLKDLALYIKRYADDIEVKGSLRPQYRKAILNGLTIAQLMGADYAVEKNKKTGVTQWHKVYLIDRITDYETNKKGDVIAVKTDFTTEYKASLTYNLGVVLDGVQNLKTPEIKLLATYISDRQVAKQNDTIAGKPITFTADTLCTKAGIINQTNTTMRYATLTKMLNDLQAEGVAVGKWTTKGKGSNITGYDKDSQTVYITPTKNVQQAYVTKEQTKAERAGYKTEQEARVKALIKYAKGYTNLDTLATEMSIERPELDKLLAGQEPITDRLLEHIDIDLVSK